MRLLFITGTDTGVGKSVASGVLALGLTRRGKQVRYLKPLETGVPEGGVAEDAALLTELFSPGGDWRERSLFTFALPASPMTAAAAEGKKIEPAKLLDALRKKIAEAGAVDYFLIEGAGGLLVPITPDFFMIDLIRELKAEAVLVTRPVLGTINQTLLSLEALRHRNIPIAGYLINWAGAEADKNIAASNRVDLEKLSGAPALGVIPHFRKEEGWKAFDVAGKEIAWERVAAGG